MAASRLIRYLTARWRRPDPAFEETVRQALRAETLRDAPPMPYIALTTPPRPTYDVLNTPIDVIQTEILIHGEVYLSGPPAAMDDLRRMLRESGRPYVEVSAHSDDEYRRAVAAEDPQGEHRLPRERRERARPPRIRDRLALPSAGLVADSPPRRGERPTHGEQAEPAGEG